MEISCVHFKNKRKSILSAFNDWRIQRKICGSKLKLHMYIKILYNRAAYTLYIKAYIKYKNKDKRWCFTYKWHFLSTDRLLTAFSKHGSTGVHAETSRIQNAKGPGGRNQCLQREMDMNTNAEGFFVHKTRHLHATERKYGLGRLYRYSVL